MANPRKETGTDQFYTRILHRAYMFDGNIRHTGEALALAMLLNAKGKDRSQKELDEISKMLDDPNLDNPRK